MKAPLLHPLKTYGNSMKPIFISKDIVYYQKVPAVSLKVDDIIVVKTGSGYITHRIVYLQKKQKTISRIITKGDNNVNTETVTRLSDILGKVVLVKRNKKAFNPQDLYLFQSTLYLKEITEVTHAFDKEVINYVILKGLPLHLYFEKKHPKRLYADCDLLIHKKDLSKTFQLLKQLGYTPFDAAFSNIHKRLKDKITEVTYTKTINGWKVFLDIHAEAVFLMNQVGKLNTLYPQSLIDSLTKTLLDGKRFVAVEKQRLPVLSEENLVLYLALHLFHHNFKGYQRYELLHTIIRKKKINFPLLFTLIKRYKLENFVYPVFHFLQKYYSPSLPASFLQNIKPAPQIMRYIKTRVLSQNIWEGELRISSGIQRFRYIYFLSPSPWYRKVIVFFSPGVLYAVFWSVWKRLNAR